MRLTAVVVPDLVLFLVLAGWAITQALTLQAARWLLKHSRAESVRQKTEVVEHFDEELRKVKEDLGAADDAGKLEVRIQEVQDSLTARLDELKIEDRISEVRDDVRTFYEDFATFSGTLGKDIKSLEMRLIGEKGTEVAALQRYLDQDHEVDEQVGLMEAVASEDPELMVAAALAKVNSISPSEKWVKENPIKAMIWEGSKPMLLGKLAEFLDVQTPRRLRGTAGKTGSYSSPYGP